jgi:N-acetylglucosaminylphosphatidylinositol deacetylase
MEDLLTIAKPFILLLNAFIFLTGIILIANARSSLKPLEEGKNGHPLKKKRVILVTAHPDDESMFFLPLIHAFHHDNQHTKWEIFLLCLSRGNFDGLGVIREQEMKTCGTFLGLQEKNIFVLEDPKLQDGMQNKWDPNHIAEIVTSFTQEHDIEVVFTFDNYGISGHPNHIAVYHGVQRAIQSSATNSSSFSSSSSSSTTTRHLLHGWKLESTTLWRKFIGVLDTLFSLQDNSLFVFVFHPRWNYQAMALHVSQFVWYRRLFVIFSRYSFINTFTPISTTETEKQKKKQ